MRNDMRRQHGFTLIELMITVVIVGILAAIAYPAYTKYVQRGYRAEGIAMLLDAAARMERYYAQNNSYALPPDPEALPDSNTPDLGAIGITVPTSKSDKYTLSFNPNPTATTYKLQVVPKNGQDKDTCGTLTLDQAGTQTSTTGTDCWK